jgi:hypothetical protein
VSGIGFAKLVDRLRCHRIRERIRIPARWVTIRHDHKLIRVRTRPQTVNKTVTRCHPRVVRRQVPVWRTVFRNGKRTRVRRTKTIRVVETPHVVMRTSKRIAHGAGTTVSGWLGLADGTAVGRQKVRVLTAPDNGLGHFVQATVVTTRPDGSWHAELRPGPSRLVLAVYGGASTLEPSTSTQVRLLVPARVKLLSISPRRVAWGGTVRITGRLEGGYLPPGGALVRLRIGFGSAYTTYGVQEHVTGSGRFWTTYTFGAGDPSIHRTYWFQIASLPIGDYPYQPAASNRITVVVGGHPVAPRVRAIARSATETARDRWRIAVEQG